MVDEEENQQKQMCSNSNSGGGGAGGGGGGGCGCAKKLKVQKVPQRGSGVAELEKILREQQKKEEDKAEVEGFFSSVSPLPPRYHPHSSSILYPLPPPPPPPPLTTSRTPATSPSSSNCLPKHVQLMQKLDLICPPPFSVATRNGGGGGGGSVSSFGSSAVVLPRNGSFPAMWRSCQSNFNGEVSKSDSGFPFSKQLSNESTPFSPLPHPLQRKCHQYPHSIMNPFPPAASSVSALSSAGVLNHHIEHPSNQRSHNNYTSMWPEKEKMVGMKRLWPFSVDYPTNPFLRCNVPPFFPQMNRPPDQSSASSAFNSEPMKTIFRDVRWSGLSELNSKKYNTDYGTLDGNILTLCPPTIPSPSTQTLKEEFSELEFPVQNGSMEDSYQRSVPGGSVNQKPFYSFLQTKRQMGSGETCLSLDNDESEAGGDGVDLNLKL